jgi:mTERF domain-containing protein
LSTVDWQVIVRHPLLLTNSVKETMTPRVEFLRSLGVSREGVAKMVTRHPQILHYKIESMLPRLRYLQSIGMSEEDIILCVSRLSQIFSLSVDNSLRPKFDYLTSQLGGDVATVTSYPAYFSLSLEKRIKPRHLILLESNKCKLPFPMKWFSMKDEDFAEKVAGVSLAEFYAFRDKLVAESEK